jgi:hypothetical protein
LAGEIADQLDLLFGEGAYFLSKDSDGANNFIILEERHSN